MKKLVFLFVAFSCVGCYAEWDLPKTPRVDPCTKQVEDAYVYVEPTCVRPMPVVNNR